MGTIELIASFITAVIPNTNVIYWTSIQAVQIVVPSVEFYQPMLFLKLGRVSETQLCYSDHQLNLIVAIGIPDSSTGRILMKDNRPYLLCGSAVGKTAANSALGGRGVYPVHQGSQNA
jgi:hypothetical protein